MLLLKIQCLLSLLNSRNPLTKFNHTTSAILIPKLPAYGQEGQNQGQNLFLNLSKLMKWRKVNALRLRVVKANQNGIPML